jgi:DNA-binding NtrC family response regulator
MRSGIVISNQPSDGAVIRGAFRDSARINMVSDMADAIRAMSAVKYDLAFADLDLLADYLPGVSPEDAIKQLKCRSSAIEIVVMASIEEMRRAIGWVKAGATDFVTYPLTVEQIRLVKDSIAASILKQSELDYLRTQFWKTDALDVVRTKSPAMAEVFKKIQSAAPTKTTIMLSGETAPAKRSSRN